MLSFILRRLGASLLLILVLSAIIFLLQKITPGDPVRAYIGLNASPEAVAVARQSLGLNDPLPLRYLHFLGRLLHGDLGISLRTHRSVVSDLSDFLPATAELVMVAFVFALALGTLFAVSGALRWRGSSVLRGLLLVLATAPSFLLALAGIVLFYSHLGWLPGGGRGANVSGPTGFLLLDSLVGGDLEQWSTAFQHLILPALALAIAPAIAIGRILRASLETTMDADHVRTARAKGLTETAVLGSHVIRNSVGPALSMAGLQLGFMFAGVIVVEQIFSWPGIGNYLARSIPVSDFPAIAAVTLVLGTIYIVANALVDLLQAVADPRLNL